MGGSLAFNHFAFYIQIQIMDPIHYDEGFDSKRFDKKMSQKFPNISDYWKLPKKKKESNASYKDDLPNQVVRSAHGYKWFGLWGTAEDSLKKYGIAARCIDLERFEYECYAPDPDEDDCSIYFVTTEGYMEEKVRKSPLLSSFLIRLNISMKEFLLMEITDKVYAVCHFFDIIDLLDLQIDETFERDSIELIDDNVNEPYSSSGKSETINIMESDTI